MDKKKTIYEILLLHGDTINVPTFAFVFEYTF